MSDIADLERRITAALDRIGVAADKLGGGEEGDASLAAELAAEREANAQLEERVQAIKERQETTVAGLQDEVTALRQALSDTDADLQRLRAVNADLRKSNADLRDANAQGLADASLVNAALEEELKALRELNTASRSEIDRALAELEPMLKEASGA